MTFVGILSEKHLSSAPPGNDFPRPFPPSRSGGSGNSNRPTTHHRHRPYHARPIPWFNRAGGSPLFSKSGRLSRPLKSAAQRGDTWSSWSIGSIYIYTYIINYRYEYNGYVVKNWAWRSLNAHYPGSVPSGAKEAWVAGSRFLDRLHIWTHLAHLVSCFNWAELSICPRLETVLGTRKKGIAWGWRRHEESPPWPPKQNQT